MTPDQWKKLTPDHMAEVWGTLSNSERAAIIAEDGDALKVIAQAAVDHLAAGENVAPTSLPSRWPERKVHTVVAYVTPSLCSLLNVLAVLCVLAGFFFITKAEITAGVMVFASAFSLLAWAQMLDHIARAAHYTRQTADLLVALLNR